jgi:hypothetical protein
LEIKKFAKDFFTEKSLVILKKCQKFAPPFDIIAKSKGAENFKGIALLTISRLLSFSNFKCSSNMYF